MNTPLDPGDIDDEDLRDLAFMWALADEYLAFNGDFLRAFLARRR